ncbi:MAG: hypothetical protein ACRYFS_01255 [Janthinobacterium lividum]
MNSKTCFSAVALTLLTAVFFSSSRVSAQFTYAPDPSTPPALTDIQIRPVELSLFPFLLTSRLQFKAENGSLFLTQTVEGLIIDNKTETDVWSGKLGAEPQKFTLKVTEDDQSISDQNGKVIWSEPLKPGLIMDFDQHGCVRVLDADGKQLGVGFVDKEAGDASLMALRPKQFRGSSFVTEGMRVDTDPVQQITSVYSGTQLIWSGPRPSNDGIQWGRVGNVVSGIALRQYPAGTTIDFEITPQTATMTISDKEHRLLETAPAETLRLTALSGDEKFRSDIRNYFLYHAPPTITQANLNVPGQIRVLYRTSGGDWAGEKSIHVMKKTRQATGTQRSETDLEVWTADFDKNGNRIGGGQYVQSASYNNG